MTTDPTDIELYNRTMHDEPLDFTKGLFIVRVWDGMDGCWTDCTGWGSSAEEGVSAEEALRLWKERTKNGTEKIRYDEIDYYKIFRSGTRMLWDGKDGREMFR